MTPRPGRRHQAARAGLTLPQLVLILFLLLLIAGAIVTLSMRRGAVVTTGRAVPPGASVFPVLNPKPLPREIVFQGCPAVGDGGDRALNELKNRVDEGAYVTVPFDSVVRLPWPRAIERRDRARWSGADASAIARYEGIPVLVEGYLAGAKAEGPESPNCHGADSEFRDYHVWLTRGAGDDRSNSIVVEVTPRLRAQHPGWRIENLRPLVRDSTRVRIGGWLMMDQEHPDQVGRTRGTIWEIHPITRIEVKRGGSWTPLDRVPKRR